jgi:hypothetical protein
LARSGEHGRHACTGGGGVQRQKRLHAEARLDGRPGRVTSVSPPRQSSTTLCLAYYSIRRQTGSRVAAGGAVPEEARRSSQCAPKRRTRGSRGSREGGGGAKKGGRRAEQRPYGGHRAWWGGGGRWGFPVYLCCRWQLCNSEYGLERGVVGLGLRWASRWLFGSAQCYYSLTSPRPDGALI